MAIIAMSPPRAPSGGGEVKRRLAGFSGAQVLVVDRPGGIFVRKLAGTPEQGVRLRRQAQKQSWARSALAGVAEVPEVLEVGEFEGCFYFDMPFVEGVEAPTFLRTASGTELVRFVRTLGRVLRRFEELGLADTSTVEPLLLARRKCAGILEGLAADDRSNRISRILVERLAKALATMPDLRLPATPNHGDLTLENIIVRPDGGLALVDASGTYLSHWLADLSKLGQDLVGGWYARTREPVPAATLAECRRLLLAELAELQAWPSHLTTALTAVDLARALPYANCDQDRQFICRGLQRLLPRFTGPAIEAAA